MNERREKKKDSGIIARWTR